jgi:hypothetical protein
MGVEDERHAAGLEGKPPEGARESSRGHAVTSEGSELHDDNLYRLPIAPRSFGPSATGIAGPPEFQLIPPQQTV